MGVAHTGGGHCGIGSGWRWMSPGSVDDATLVPYQHAAPMRARVRVVFRG